MIRYEVGHERLFQGDVLIILGNIVVIEHIVVLGIGTTDHERDEDQEEESVALHIQKLRFSHDQQKTMKIRRLVWVAL